MTIWRYDSCPAHRGSQWSYPLEGHFSGLQFSLLSKNNSQDCSLTYRLMVTLLVKQKCKLVKFSSPNQNSMSKEY
jgi:hypothetical protein